MGSYSPTMDINQKTIRERFSKLDMDFLVFFLQAPEGNGPDFEDRIVDAESKLIEQVGGAVEHVT